jgi:hypothetical protein
MTQIFKFYYSPTEYIELDPNLSAESMVATLKAVTGKDWYEKGRYDKLVYVDGDVTYHNDSYSSSLITEEEYDAHWKRKLLIKTIKEL